MDNCRECKNYKRFYVNVCNDGKCEIHGIIKFNKYNVGNCDDFKPIESDVENV